MIRIHTPTLAGLALVVSLMTSASPLSAQTTYTINSLGDQANAQNDANCVSTAGTCTLRTALQASLFASSPITIEIAAGIPTNSSGKSIINVNSPLPPIVVPTTIAGETHPNYSGGGFTYLVINGNSGVDNASGLVLSGASGSTIRHIAVRGFGEDGILVANGGNYSITDNVIGGSWVNTNVQIDGNGDNGIRIVNASSSGNSTVIQDNVVMANGGSGIVVQDGSSNTVIQGNIIGLQPPLFFPGAFRPQAGNGGDGIVIDDSAGPGNLIGFFAGNTVSNNAGTGIRIRADEQSVFGNRIGVPHEGEVASGYSSEDYGNGGSGVALLSSSNTVGGTGGQRNVIGHNASNGVSLGSSLLSNPVEATNNSVIGNWVGTDNEGTSLGQPTGILVINGFDNVIRNNTISFNDTGLSIYSGGSFYTRNRIVKNVIRGVSFRGAGQLGSTDWADANVIADQPAGIQVYDYQSDNPSAVVAIRKNYIGTDADGEFMGNETGIIVQGADNRVWIGQTDGSGNVIADNNTGIRLRGGASGVLVAGNLVGVHRSGQAMGNDRGIALSEFSGAGAYNNQIGFSLTDAIDPETWTPGEDASNVIAYNFSAIELLNGGDGTVNNSIRGNRIFGNLFTELPGINLGMEELDIGGAAAGPNNQMNYPELDPGQTQINPATGEIEYRFRVQTDAANAAYPLVIDFYLADGDTQQGEIFLGSDEYLASQTFEFRSGSLPIPESVPSSGFLVATATDADGNTSQFTIDPVELQMPDSLFQDRFETP
jgi:parallel beta-helix repeat protein